MKEKVFKNERDMLDTLNAISRPIRLIEIIVRYEEVEDKVK